MVCDMMQMIRIITEYDTVSKLTVSGDFLCRTEEDLYLLSQAVFMNEDIFHISGCVNPHTVIIQCVPLAGSPGKYWFTKRTKVEYICMSYL
jgi:hypothetical protein